MATQIIWDEDTPTSPEPAEELVPSPTSPTMVPLEVYRSMFLGTVDTHELIAELNKRGMMVTARTSGYMTIPTTTSATTQLDFQHVTYGGLQQAALSGGIYQQSLGAVDAAKNKW